MLVCQVVYKEYCSNKFAKVFADFLFNANNEISAPDFIQGISFSNFFVDSTPSKIACDFVILKSYNVLDAKVQ